MNLTLRTALCGVFACLPYSAFACASCGCTLSGDWESQGFTSQPGVRVDLRYDYLDQSQLRSGTGRIDRAAIVLPNEREIEQSTKNQYTTVGVDYSPNADWGINLQLPYVNRSHSTVAPGDVELSSSHTRSLGDVRLIGRYQGLRPQRNVGLQFGLKLPTGDYRKTFSDGPQTGQLLDRGLQPGSGSTDLLLGAFVVGGLSEEVDYYAQAMLQTPLASKENYRPGLSVNLNVGMRYVASEKIVPELQLNVRTVRRDSGDNADVENSGGTLAYLSPGVTVAVSQRIKLYGFVQVPIYQRVTGYQLTPRYTASLGARYVF